MGSGSAERAMAILKTERAFQEALASDTPDRTVLVKALDLFEAAESLTPEQETAMEEVVADICRPCLVGMRMGNLQPHLDLALSAFSAMFGTCDDLMEFEKILMYSMLCYRKAEEGKQILSEHKEIDPEVSEADEAAWKKWYREGQDLGQFYFGPALNHGDIREFDDVEIVVEKLDVKYPGMAELLTDYVRNALRFPYNLQRIGPSLAQDDGVEVFEEGVVWLDDDDIIIEEI